MSGILLDTNVISELVRPKPDSKVVKYLRANPDTFLSVITLHELIYGSLKITDPGRRQKLIFWVRDIEKKFAKNIIAADNKIAHRAAFLRAQEALEGHILHLADSLIAATANMYDMPLATRNIKDFEGLGLELHNPWL